MKRLLKIVIAVICIALVGYVIASFMVNDQTRRAIETHTTEALGVQTTLERAKVGILGGTFRLDDLNIANVRNFHSPYLLRLGSGTGSVRLGSLLGDVAELPNITLSDIELHLERLENSGNYDHVIRNIREMEQEPASDKEDQRYVIRELVLRNVAVHVTFAPGVGEPLSLRIPIDQLRLTNVGTEGNRGVLIQELVGQIFTSLVTRALEVAGDELPGRIADEIGQRLGELEGLQKVLDGVGEQFRDLEKAIPEDLIPEDIIPEGIMDSPLGDLLPGRGQ